MNISRLYVKWILCSFFCHYLLSHCFLAFRWSIEYNLCESKKRINLLNHCSVNYWHTFVNISLLSQLCACPSWFRYVYLMDAELVGSWIPEQVKPSDQFVIHQFNIHYMALIPSQCTDWSRYQGRYWFISPQGEYLSSFCCDWRLFLIFCNP